MAASSHSPEQLEVAELLARRAAGDLRVARKLSPDPEIDEGAIGFHAQQAVEKALKVALTLKGSDFPKTHDLDSLDRDAAVAVADRAVAWCMDQLAEALAGGAKAGR